MITIPAAIQTLLKSKMMVGENRPTGYVEVGGMPIGSLKDPTTWTAWPTFVGRSGYTQTNGNMEETADKRAIISYYADDNLFTDEAGNTLTPIANIHTDNTVKKFGASSAALDGSYDGISVVDSESWNLANGWTIEFQLYLDELEVKLNYYALKTGMWGSTWIFMSTYADGVMKWTFWNGGFEYGFQDVEFTPEAGQFYHVAVCQDGEHWYLFIEGQQLAKTTPARMELSNPYNPLHIMGYEDHSPKAHIDEYRVSDIARYTAPFTPPTEPFEMDEHTVLLLHCDDPNLGKRVEIAYADSVAGVLAQTKEFGAGTLIDIGEDFNDGQVSLARIDGKLCMVLFWTNESGGYHKAEYWRDEDGNGTNFQKVSLISDSLRSGFVYEYGGSPVTVPTRLPNGDLVVILPYWYGLWERGKRGFYSTDDGGTWIAGAYWVNYYVGTGCSHNPLIIGDDSFIVNDWGSSGVTRLLKFTGSGASMSIHDWTGDWGEGSWAQPLLDRLVQSRHCAVYVTP